MKKAVISLISLTVVGLIAYTLYANKEEMKADAKLSEVTSAVIPVKVVSVKKIALEEKVSADGVFIAKTDLALLSETQGKVVRVYKEKGSHVEKGELLAQVENDLIQSEVAAAQANYEKLQSDLERFTKLSENDAVTGRQLEEVKIGLKNAEAQYRSAKKRLENTYIRATASGNINDDFIQEGAFVSPGAKLYEIVDISVLKLNVKVSATEVLRVKEGDEVKITSSVYPDTQFTGKVTAVASKADAALKYGVEIVLQNKGDKTLKPGMYATAFFSFHNEEEKYYVDRNTLIGSVQDPQVFVVEDSVAKLRDIVIGETHNDLIRVLNGLDQNDKVVISGQINLAEGTRVKVLD